MNTSPRHRRRGIAQFDHRNSIEEGSDPICRHARLQGSQKKRLARDREWFGPGIQQLASFLLLLLLLVYDQFHLVNSFGRSSLDADLVIPSISLSSILNSNIELIARVIRENSRIAGTRKRILANDFVVSRPDHLKSNVLIFNQKHHESSEFLIFL